MNRKQRRKERKRRNLKVSGSGRNPYVEDRLKSRKYQRQPYKWPFLTFTRKILSSICTNQPFDSYDIQYEPSSDLEKNMEKYSKKFLSKRSATFLDLYELLAIAFSRKDKKKKRKIIQFYKFIVEDDVNDLMELQKGHKMTSKVCRGFVQIHFLFTRLIQTQHLRYFIDGRLNELYISYLNKALELQNDVYVLLCCQMLSILSIIMYENGLKEVSKRENIKKRNKRRKEIRDSKNKKSKNKKKKEEEGEKEDSEEGEKSSEEEEEEVDEKESNYFALTKKIGSKVKRIRESLLDSNLINTICTIMSMSHKSRIQKYTSSFILRYLQNILRVTWDDYDAFNELIKHLNTHDISISLSAIFRNFAEERDHIGAALSVVYYMTMGPQKQRAKLLDVYELILKIFCEGCEKNDDDLVCACGDVLSLLGGESILMLKRISQGKNFLEHIVTFLKREAKKHRLSCNQFDTLAVLCAAMEVASEKDMMIMDVKYGLINLLVRKFQSSLNDIDDLYPVVIAIKVMCGKYEKPNVCAKVLEKLIEEDVLEGLLKKILKLMKRKREDNRSLKDQREGYFGYPSFASALNAILQMCQKMDKEKHESVFSKMTTKLRKNEMYPRIVQSVMNLERTKVSKFSYKNVLVLFFIVVAIIVLMPIIYKLIKGSRPPVSVDDIPMDEDEI